MNGDKFLELLCPYVDGELCPDDVRKVEEHLVDCGGCRHELDQLRSLIEELRDLPAVMAPPVLFDSILRGIGERRPARSRSTFLRQFLAVAAAVLLAVWVVSIDVVGKPRSSLARVRVASAPTTEATLPAPADKGSADAREGHATAGGMADETESSLAEPMESRSLDPSTGRGQPEGDEKRRAEGAVPKEALDRETLGEANLERRKDVEEPFRLAAGLESVDIALALPVPSALQLIEDLKTDGSSLPPGAEIEKTLVDIRDAMVISNSLVVEVGRTQLAELLDQLHSMSQVLVDARDLAVHYGEPARSSQPLDSSAVFRLAAYAPVFDDSTTLPLRHTWLLHVMEVPTLKTERVQLLLQWEPFQSESTLLRLKSEDRD